MSVAIFDLDGLLIDSEPLWRRAEVEVFGALGVPLSEEMCRQTTGLRIDEVVAYWRRRHPWPERPGSDIASVAAQNVERVRQLIEQEGKALPGVARAVEMLRGAGWRLAVASSSPPVLIEAALRRLQLLEVFEAFFSAADEERGKPDPAVYLTATRRLGVEPASAIAFEDSAAGVRSAHAAGLRVVAVPDTESWDDGRFAAADWKLRSLADFSLELVSHPV